MAEGSTNRDCCIPPNLEGFWGDSASGVPFGSSVIEEWRRWTYGHKDLILILVFIFPFNLVCKHGILLFLYKIVKNNNSWVYDTHLQTTFHLQSQFCFIIDYFIFWISKINDVPDSVTPKYLFTFQQRTLKSKEIYKHSQTWGMWHLPSHELYHRCSVSSTFQDPRF